MLNDKELKEKIKSYKNGTLEIYAIERTGIKGDYEYMTYRPYLKRSLEKELRENIIDHIDVLLNDREVIPFDPVLKEVNTVDYLKDNIENLNKVSCMLSDIRCNAIDDIMLEKIWGYALVFNMDNSKIIMFRKYAYPKMFKEGMICELSEEGALGKLEKQIMTIDSNVDAVYIGDEVYIFNRYKFENFFSFNEIYRDKVNESLDVIRKIDVVDNLDEFAVRCLRSDRLTKQFVKLLDGNRFEWIKNNSCRLADVKVKYDLDITLINGKLVYTEEDSIKDIINLISGSYAIDAVDDSKVIVKDSKPYLKNRGAA